MGTQAGKEVVQLYVSKPNSTIDRPVQELKAFGKTRKLAPGETETMTFKIPVSDLKRLIGTRPLRVGNWKMACTR